MGKSKEIKRKLKEVTNTDDPDPDSEAPPKIRFSDEPVPKKEKWINKQRVLIFASRGISHRDRHLMQDLRSLMPHSKSESKMERKDSLFVINEMCEMKNCNKCVLFEGRLKRDLYMWIANVPHGPSAKFLVESVYTMAELKLTGNCLKGSRPLLSFDEHFNSSPHYSLLKELFVQIFGTPYHHPKSQPFIDHVMTFSVVDNRIWFRNYQILSEDGALAEIGPRYVLNPIKIFNGSFQGETLWENSHYISPALYRRQLKKAAANKYENRLEKKMAYEASKPKESYQLNALDEMFSGDPLEKANEIETQILSSTLEPTVQNPKRSKKTKLKKQVFQNEMKKQVFQNEKKKKQKENLKGVSKKNMKFKKKNDFKKKMFNQKNVSLAV